jgi:transcriptional regulator with XRE-family HTH domain
MSLARRIRDARNAAGLTLDELAAKSGISKTYIWELEKDESGEKKPSAEVLLKIANALSTTIAQLLALPTVQAKTEEVILSASLLEFRDRMAKQGTPLKDHELRDLATTQFRGGQPRTVDDWNDLYLALVRTTKRKK